MTMGCGTTTSTPHPSEPRPEHRSFEQDAPPHHGCGALDERHQRGDVSTAVKVMDAQPSGG